VGTGDCACVQATAQPITTAIQTCDTGIVSVERLIVDVMRWEHLSVDVSSADDLQAVVGLTGRALDSLMTLQSDRKPLSVRVTITGRSAAHGDLFGSHAQLREEVLAQAAALGGDRLWIEKVRVETSPLADALQIRERADAISDLQALLDQVPGDEAFMRSLAAELQQLAGKAPHELNESVPDLEAIRLGDVGEIVRSVTPMLIAQLAQAR